MTKWKSSLCSYHNIEQIERREWITASTVKTKYVCVSHMLKVLQGSLGLWLSGWLSL